MPFAPVAKAPRVNAFPVTALSNTTLPPFISKVLFCAALGWEHFSEPALTVVTPVKLLLAKSVSEPGPKKLMPFAPPRPPERVSALADALLTFKSVLSQTGAERVSPRLAASSTKAACPGVLSKVSAPPLPARLNAPPAAPRLKPPTMLLWLRLMV